MKKRWYIMTLMMGVLAWSSCSSIDDDLSNCANDFELDYELRLVTNMTTELQTQLNAETDISVATALRTYLSDIFTDFAHDVDLSFYDTEGDSLRLQHDEHVMDANQASYTLNLPMREYMHLAAANVVDNPIVDVYDDERCHTAKIQQVASDTISSHTTGIFSARLPMEVLSGVDQTFNVHLYMANCATSLVVDTLDSGIRDIKVFTTGFASGYNVADSVYHFAAKPPIIHAQKVETESEDQVTFCSVNFPSREPAATRTVIETTDPFVSPTSEESLWEYHIYVMLEDGSITETILYVMTPLRAGQLRIIKCKANKNGGVEPTNMNDHTVGVSITTDWGEGWHFEPDL